MVPGSVLDPVEALPPVESSVAGAASWLGEVPSADRETASSGTGLSSRMASQTSSAWSLGATRLAS